MDQDLFKSLPPELIINILSRLPVSSILTCKCVCKSWLHLVETNEFTKSHISNSSPTLLVYEHSEQSNLYRMFEFEDGPNHELQYKPFTNFNPPNHGWMRGSSNGLLFLHNHNINPDDLYICNPITRECIELHCPQDFSCSYSEVAYGFGASKVTGQHKVVRIFHGYIGKLETIEWPSKSDCQVYTLGSGSWRSISLGPTFRYADHMTCLNGDLQCLAFDVNGIPLVSCFNLEIEIFSTFSTPIPSHGGNFLDVFALVDCLCLCENTLDDKIVIWSMKEYGVAKSWTKEFVINKASFTGEPYGILYPIKVLKDGLLIVWECEDASLFRYSKKDSATQKIDIFEPHTLLEAILHCPSFLSLKSYGMENVTLF